ncbi:hypothetical protein [uncultured Winogradskyella sp.]|uniref:hypothetical protein n=1 Tax=uncultured Winogradskyella sp. TaxID=395353 RepID=UPI0030DC47FD|tara:strand:+ start:125404 stop:125790 length:387 start_codon:yes stop_codon:yes gene_type:complete
MKRLITILPALMLFSCYTIERDCTDFKTGEFEFKYTVDGKENTGRFTRTDLYNIDYYEGKVDSSSVRWINDCEFILKKLNPTNQSEKEAIHMKILSTSENAYTFEYKLAVKKANRPLAVEQGTATKIN